MFVPLQKKMRKTMKNNHIIIGTIALLTIAGCGNNATDKNTSLNDSLNVKVDTTEISSVQNEKADEETTECRNDEMAKVVRLLQPCESSIYNEETGERIDCTTNLEPDYYPYQGETKDCYLVCIGQDGPYTIPKKFAEITTWSASQGHGYVLLFNEKSNTVLLKTEPNDASKTIESFPDPEGIPDCAECLGITGEWYKVDYYGKTGYVRRNESQWGINHSEACGQIR